MKQDRERLAGYLEQASRMKLGQLYFGTRGPAPPDDVLFLPTARFIRVLSGSQHMILPLAGKAREVVLQPGDMQISAHDSWEKEQLIEPHEKVCIVPRADFLRVSYYRFYWDEDGEIAGDGYEFHTPHNVSAPLRYTARALTACAQGTHHPEAARSLALALAHLAIAELQTAQHPLPQSKAEATYQDLRHWLDTYCHQPTMNRDRVADAFALSPAYVSRLFKRFTGESFVDYLTRLRLDFAEQLLRDTELPVGEVAAQCGFSSASYFVRRFHQRRGVTPGDYRLSVAAR